MSTPEIKAVRKALVPDSARVVSIQELRAHCSTCTVRELCLPVGLGAEDLRQIDALVGPRMRLRRGAALYRAGASFTSLYALRVGSLKTTVLAEDGREQVAGFHLQGEVVGLDGVGTS
jgi:CRP/FNR family transcriptional regulator